MLKRLVAFLFAISTIFSVAAPIAVNAQNLMPSDEAEGSGQTERDTALARTSVADVTIILGNQSIWDMTVPLTINFTSNIEADRVEINWDSPDGIFIQNDFNNYFKIMPGQEYSLNATLIPDAQGRYTVSGTVILWRNDTNYARSEKFVIEFDNELNQVPKPANYTQQLLLKYFIFFIVFVVFAIAAFFLGRIGLRRLKEWLKPPF